MKFIRHDFLFLDFFTPGNSIVLILFGWLQNFGVRKSSGFSLVDIKFFAQFFGALKNSQKNDAMNVRRDGKSLAVMSTGSYE